MLIFEAWDIVAMCAEHAINESDSYTTNRTQIKLREAFKKCDGLMDLILMKIDSMEEEITITRDELKEVLGDGK